MEKIRPSEFQEPASEQKEALHFNVEQAVDAEGGVMRRLGEISKGTIGKGLRTMTLAATLFASGVVAKEASAHPSVVPHVHDRAGIAHRVDGHNNRFRHEVQPGDEYKWQAMSKPGQGDAYKQAAMGNRIQVRPMTRTEIIIERIADRLADEIVDGIWPEENK